MKAIAALRQWLDALAHARGWGAAFETRIGWTPRGATGTIEAKPRTAGSARLARGERFIVGGSSGPLKEGEPERARARGTGLADLARGQPDTWAGVAPAAPAARIVDPTHAKENPSWPRRPQR